MIGLSLRIADMMAKAGYVKEDGTPDIELASLVFDKFGALLPKNQVPDADIKELAQAAQKLSEKTNLSNDVFEK